MKPFLIFLLSLVGAVAQIPPRVLLEDPLPAQTSALPPPVQHNQYSTNMPGAPVTSPVVVSNAGPLAADFPSGLIRTIDPVNGPINSHAQGTVGDGVVDDTIALQSLLTTSGTSVYLPVGRYRITAPLRVTNTSIYGEPDRSWIVPDNGVIGAALTIITAGTDAQHYSPKSVIRGVSIDGSKNPSGTGFCLGTNFLTGGGGIYSANITLDQCRADGFTNGAGVYVQYLLSSRITRTTCESNFNGMVLDGRDIGITTLQVDNSNFRWSLDWGIVGTNVSMGNVGPNNIFEANKKGGIHLDQGYLGSFVGIHGNHFEKEYWQVPQTTNSFDVEIYGTNNTFKVHAFIQDNFFDTSIGMLMVTNVGHAVWGNNAVYSPLPGSVLVRGIWSFLNIEDFPANQNAATCFVAPESGSALIWSSQQIDTNQFEYLGENPISPMLRLRGYAGNGVWKIPLQVNVDGSNQIVQAWTDTNILGHQQWWFNRYNGTPGRLVLRDNTSSINLLDIDGASGTVTGLGTASFPNLTMAGNGTLTYSGRAFLSAVSAAGELVLYNSGGTALGSIDHVDRYVAKTSNYPLVVQDSYAVFSNNGAGSEVDFTLPTASAGSGLRYTFIVEAAQTLKVIAQSGETIRLGGSTSTTGGNAVNAVVGGSITLIGASAAHWIAMAHEGTWTLN